MKYKWGITGTGMIAHEMADALKIIKNAEVTAVLSRREETAQKFANKYDIPNTFTDLNEFAASDCFDIAYIASPHNYHKNETITCLKGGKAVLCEKPMGVNQKEVDAMIETAKKENKLLIEAFWTYYFPAMKKAFNIIEEGVIGKPLMIDARFCFSSIFDAADRKYNPDLAGGALLDIGLYCISLAQMVFREFPITISGVPAISVTGVDESSSYILKYRGNRIATLTSSFRVESQNDAWIYGEKGNIKIPKFWQPDKIIVIVKGKEKKYKFKRFGNGYTYEAIEMMKYLDEGKKESPLFSLGQSRELVKIMDKLRLDWGLKYPFEG